MSEKDEKKEKRSEETSEKEPKKERTDPLGMFDGEPKIMGSGLIKLIEDMVSSLKGMSPMPPVDDLDDCDCDGCDPVVKKLNDDHGGMGGMIRIIKLSDPKAIEKLSSIINELRAVRESHRNSLLRQAFQHIQLARNVADEVANLERFAARQDEPRSEGWHQAQAVKTLDLLLKDASGDEREALSRARKAVLAGTEGSLDAAGFRVRNLFASNLPSLNVRVAYTTLGTQDDDQFLMCPKGLDVFGRAVPMEASKCRDNCIDADVTRDGRLSCAYAKWLKTAETHGTAMGRLDTMRHPDNEVNLMTLAENERSKPLPKEIKGTEEALDGDKKRGKDAPKDATEKQLDDAGKTKGGHRGEAEKSVMEETSGRKAFNAAKRRLAEKPKTIEEQLRDSDDSIFEDEIMEERLEEGSPQHGGRRGEQEESYMELTMKKASVDRIDPDSKDTLGEQIAADHEGEIDDATIEQMLEDERVGLTDEELDMLLDEWVARERKDD